MMETPSTMTPTLMPTTAPTILVTASTMASGQSDNYFKDNMTWMVLWVITLVVFLVFPFATSKRRRMLCARGIRERRWIPDEEIEEELRREEMQQRMEAVRTQEDSIRRQYLSFLMQRYTVVSQPCSFVPVQLNLHHIFCWHVLIQASPRSIFLYDFLSLHFQL